MHRKSEVGVRIAILATVLVSAVPLIAQQSRASSSKSFAPDMMDNVLYGVAYYPEYMPYDRLDTDVELMRKAGISFVRVGE